MSSMLEAPAAPAQAFESPAVALGDTVLFNNGHNGVWFPAAVTRVGYGSSGIALEVIVTSHDGGGVDGADRGAANVHQFARDNVKHVDDPDAQTEQYRVHVLGDNEGGLWKLTETDVARRKQLTDLEAQLQELRKALNSRSSKSNQN